MKFFHLSDLHLGKRVNGFSMIEDQKYILQQIIELADREVPDAVIIAGDVYDKSIPSVEAVNLFDDFLVSLAQRNLQIFVISGNHDSAERISYGGRVMEQSGIHISRRITGDASSSSTDPGEGGGLTASSSSADSSEDSDSTDSSSSADSGEGGGLTTSSSSADSDGYSDSEGSASFEKTKENKNANKDLPAAFLSVSLSSAGTDSGKISIVRLEDEYGDLNVCLIPYIHPSVVRAAWPEETVGSWTEAMEVLLRHADIDPEARNIAVAHQYVTADGVRPEESDSEQKHIGGLDNVEYSIFDVFDYVALGHLHGPQHIGRPTVRYAGSPLKYSFSEENQKKSVTVVEIREKGNVGISQIPLSALRDLRTLRGTFDELMSPEYTAALSKEDYYRVILTDEQDVDHAVSRLRKYFYTNLMELDYDNARTRAQGVTDALEEAIEKEPAEVLAELFLKQNGKAMSDFQKNLAARMIDEIWNTT